MPRACNPQSLFEDYPRVTVAQLRKVTDNVGEGSCSFNEADYVMVILPDGHQARIDLVRTTSNLGLTMSRFICPTCRRICTTLRITPTGIGLACPRDVKLEFKAKYRSQVKRVTTRT